MKFFVFFSCVDFDGDKPGQVNKCLCLTSELFDTARLYKCLIKVFPVDFTKQIVTLKMDIVDVAVKRLFRYLRTPEIVQAFCAGINCNEPLAKA